ncbi:XRE family transcriptional regulator [Streptomyces sp. FH025]|uniref:helix-turn-helix domain-containing protein n=1 Tax=Streptomyces sp. FH025 TaxID=2815937 RepID=UPI001A9CC18A|nr:XRE family transcriptional regulator [Streptomyces sp. FH025]MBO1417931.1 DUF2690 domain-containing protein [Streptomyces sp. FH025]
MASAWKELPAELSEPARLLAEELRAIKDAAGLSLSELAARTHYSRASWERWLNGKRVVTEQALEALVGAVDCDAAELRRLWLGTVAPAEEPAELPAELPGRAPAVAGEPDREPSWPAPAEDTGSIVPPAEEATGEAAGPTAWWRRPAALAGGAAAVLALLLLAGLRVARHDDGRTPAADGPVPAPVATAVAKPVPSEPTCQAVGCAHKDPKTTGCGKDARTLQTQVIGKVVVYLRYSGTCQAAWAAITEGEPKDYAVITDSTGDSETALIHWGYDNYSPMLSAADPAVGFQVCGYQPAGHDCTSTVEDLATVVASTPIPIGPASPPPGAGAGAPTPGTTATGTTATGTTTAGTTAGDPSAPSPSSSDVPQSR